MIIAFRSFILLLVSCKCDAAFLGGGNSFTKCSNVQQSSFEKTKGSSSIKNVFEDINVTPRSFKSKLLSSSPVSDDVKAELSPNNMPDKIIMPLSFDEMVQMTSQAMADAYEKGLTRQTIRLLLPRDPANIQLGQMFENDANIDTNYLVLSPCDETWQGGIMQLYRAAVPTMKAAIRELSINAGGMPPKIREDRSVDQSGVDGVGLLVSQSSTPSEDMSCFVQPTQETVSSVESISDQAGDRLVVLMNPQWRITDDALDAASKDGGIWRGLASFLGGKGDSMQRLSDVGFQDIFTLEGYVCKGGDIRLAKRFDSDWFVFAANDDATGYIKLGTMKDRPTYQDVDGMLDDKGIGLKYARDFGMTPKI